MGEFTIELLELKEDICIIGGVAVTDITLNDVFNLLYEIGSHKNSKKKRASIDLTVHFLVIDGEPVETVAANSSFTVGLVGNASELEAVVRDLRWKRKSGRYLRTSDTALLLSS